jgi:L-fuculose-phosphate aldolase
VFLGGEVKLARYAPSGTHELAANAIEALGEQNAVLLAGHGAIGIGRSLREAMAVCELLEKTAMVYVHALTLGRTSPLSADAISAARAAFSRLQQSPDL